MNIEQFTNITQLSILIPTFNCVCVDLVSELQRQAGRIKGLEYEIIVVDDESTDKSTIEQNRAINGLPNCRLIEARHRQGHSDMRNALSRYASYEWQIQIDSSVSVMHPNFLSTYISQQKSQVVCGGIAISCSAEMLTHNLRCKYEKHEEPNHSATKRQANPYHCFRTTNFLYHRSVLERVPFDERIKKYGFEDVMFGRDLCRAAIYIQHIDNPVTYTRFENSARFLDKVEESLLTLHNFEPELKDYSTILKHINRLRSMHLLWAVRLLHRITSSLQRHNLTGKNPSLFLFKLYKLGYYACIK